MLGLVLLLSIHAPAAPSGAVGSDAALRFDWVRTGTTAAAVCPPAEAFEVAVRRRLSSAPEGRVEGWIQRSNGGWASTIFVHRADGTVLQRSLAGIGDCAELTLASSLAAAVLLDPMADIGAQPEAPVPRDPPKPTTVAQRAPRSDSGLTLGLGAVIQSGTLPGLAVGPRLEGRWRFSGPWSVDFGMFFLPDKVSEPFGFSLAAGFFGLGGEIENGPFMLGGSVRGHLGALSAVVFSTEQSVTSTPGTYLWSAISAEVRAGVRLGSRWFLEVHGGALIGLERQRFEVAEQSQPVFREAPWAGQGGLALAVHFDE